MFRDKVVVVTGSSKGIGRAMAEAYAAHGATVVVSSRDVDRCRAVADDIYRSGGRAHAIACHMGRSDAIDALVDETVARFSTIDIVVNNAATNPALVPLLDVTNELAAKLFAVNVLGPLQLSRRAAALMAETGGGSILNVASRAAYVPEPLQGVYASTKSALLTLTKAMALEWAVHGVRVNALAPGPFATTMVKELFEDEHYRATLLDATAQRRIADPEEIVGAALYLTGATATFVTGSVLRVDGGMVP